MDQVRESTPLKRSNTRSTEPASPLRTSRSITSTDSKLLLQLWGQGLLSQRQTEPISVIDIEGERIGEVCNGETHLFICTRSKNYYGLGDNRFKQIDPNGPRECNATIPSEISQRILVQKIFCGCDYTYLIGAKTKLFSWGSNLKGQLGLGHTENVSEPTPVRNFLQNRADFNSGELPEGESPLDVACGSLHVIVRTNKDRLFSVGFGDTFALGHGTGQSFSTLKEISYFTDLIVDKKMELVKVDVGVTHSAALVGKKLVVWGMYGSDKSQTARKPQVMNIAGEVAEFALGDMLTIARTSSGDVYAFGDNTDDQLTTDSIGIVRVPMPVKIEYIAGGLNHAFGVNFSKGKVFAWGSNRFGQIAPSNSQTSFKIPIELPWLYNCGSFALTCKGNSTFFISRSRIKLGDDAANDSVRAQSQQSLPTSAQVSLTPEFRQLATELDAKTKAFENLSKENQQLREEVTRLSTMLTNSTKVSTSTSDPADTNTEINDRDLTSDRPVQAESQKGEDPQAVLRDRFQGGRNH
jgi:alpha-tubulin suppressor-like RCC1 family protein